MRYVWRRTYEQLVPVLLEKHFGGWEGVTRLFPYMKADFRWKNDDFVVDARTVLKSNNEYHGLERHARQYHVAAMYDYAHDHWLIAAAWRRDVMRANNFNDDRHLNAIQFVLQNVEYNSALFKWQKKTSRPFKIPRPEDFGLDGEMMEKKDSMAEAEINAVYEQRGLPKPYEKR